MAPERDTALHPTLPLRRPRAASPRRRARNTSEVLEARGFKTLAGAIAVTKRGMAAPRAKHPADQRSLNRTSAENLGDSEFVARVRSYCVVDHQLPGGLFCERRIEPATGVDCHEFVLFSLVICFEFLAPKLDIGLFGVGL
jgi:hypothetical protein